MITIKNLKKYYGHQRGVEDVSLTIQPQEIFGFVGPNGSGKTTLIRVILGLIEKTEGDVKVFEEDVKIGKISYLNDIGYMPSESFFFNDLKVGDIFQFFLVARNIDDSYMNHLIKQLDIDVEKKFKSLSFGNKKKIGIVVAMMHQPKLLILDEPTSGLDPLIQSRFLDLLLEQKQKGATIFLSSHVLSEIEKVCDRVSLIKEGKLLFTKTMTEIKKDEHKRIIVKPINNQLTLQGLSYLNNQNDASYYGYQGDINHLIAYLKQYQFDDVIIRDVGLEEIFSVYYETEESV